MVAQSKPGGRPAMSIILCAGCAFAELAVSPENVPRAVSARMAPARTKNRPIKTRVLKNADCEVDLFFMWIVWICERSLCSRLPCEKRNRWRLLWRSIRLRAPGSLPTPGGQCQYYFANRFCSPRHKSNALVTFTWPELPLPVQEKLSAFIRGHDDVSVEDAVIYVYDDAGTSKSRGASVPAIARTPSPPIPYGLGGGVGRGLGVGPCLGVGDGLTVADGVAVGEPVAVAVGV